MHDFEFHLGGKYIVILLLETPKNEQNWEKYIQAPKICADLDLNL